MGTELPATTKDITAEWLDEALHENGYLKGENIESIEIEPLTTGRGFLSELSKISVDYDNNERRLPISMVSKMPSTFEPARQSAQKSNFYEREIRFYDEVVPLSPLRTPSVVFSGIDSEKQRYVLIMEDCSRFTQVDTWKGFNSEQARLLALKLADFHSRWWDSDDLYSFPWLPRPDSPVSLGRTKSFRNWWDICVQKDALTGILSEEGMKIGEKIYKRYPELLNSGREKNLTIIHYDFRAGNIFIDEANKDDPFIIFDWAIAQISTGTTDLAFLLAFSLNPEVRHEIESTILNTYYEQLRSNGAGAYSFDEFQNDYRKALLLYAFAPVVALSTLDLSNAGGKAWVKMATDRWINTVVDNDAISASP